MMVSKTANGFKLFPDIRLDVAVGTLQFDPWMAEDRCFSAVMLHHIPL